MESSELQSNTPSAENASWKPHSSSDVHKQHDSRTLPDHSFWQREPVVPEGEGFADLTRLFGSHSQSSACKSDAWVCYLDEPCDHLRHNELLSLSRKTIWTSSMTPFSTTSQATSILFDFIVLHPGFITQECHASTRPPLQFLAQQMKTPFPSRHEGAWFGQNARCVTVSGAAGRIRPIARWKRECEEIISVSELPSHCQSLDKTRHATAKQRHQ